MKTLVFEPIYPADGLSCHASHFALLPDGDIFAVWFHGSAEGRDDVRISGARRRRGKWDAPRFLTPDDGLPHWNPVLHRTEDGRLILYYKVGREIASWRTWATTSLDDGEYFSGPRELIPGDESGGRGPVRNKILPLSDGSWLAPGSTEGGGWKCFADRSEDGGETWTRSADILLPEKYYRPGVPVERAKRGIIQPSFWEDPEKPGRVSALMRSTEGRVFRADSLDYGKSFGEPRPIPVPNNNSALDLALLPDGRIFLVLNPVGLPPDGCWGERTPLSLLVSEDGGETFRRVADIAAGERHVFAYPAVRYGEGMLHVTFTHDRTEILYTVLEI